MYWKINQILLQYGAAVLYCKAGQVVFEIIAGITQWDNFYDKVGAGVTEHDNFILQSGVGIKI